MTDRRSQECTGRRGRAFTLIELLVVIAIISLLVSILLPSLGRAKALAKRSICMSNLKQISLLYILYENEHEAFPAQAHQNVWPITLYEETTGGHLGFDLRVPLGPYASPDVFYCPDGGHWFGVADVDPLVLVNDPDDRGGWDNPYYHPAGFDIAIVTYALFPGCAMPLSYLPLTNPPFNFDETSWPWIKSMADVGQAASECVLATDHSFWQGGLPTIHNHPVYTGYAVSTPSTIYEGQSTSFFDGHAEWRDGDTVIDMMTGTGWVWSY